MTPVEHDGKVITVPGVYAGIPIETYHGNPFLCDGPSISSSGLREFINRPSLYWAYSPYNCKRFERTGSNAFSFGRAAHHLLLEGEAGFSNLFAVRLLTYPNDPSKAWSSNSNDCKAWLRFQEEQGRTVITQNDFDVIRWMRDSLSRHPAVQGGILDGHVEMSMVAKIKDVWLRARPDVVPVHAGDFADLKTTASIRHDDIERTIYSFGYHVQAAVVRMVSEAVMPDDFKFMSFFFVFVEKTPPFDVRVVELKPDALELGQQQAMAAITKLKACISRMEFPGEEGFSPGITFAGIPTWARARTETAMAYEAALPDQPLEAQE